MTRLQFTYLICIITFACACSTGQRVKEVTISGMVHNHDTWPQQKEVHFGIFDVGLADQTIYPAKIHDNGSFQVQFPLISPQDIVIGHSVTFLAFVHPGDSLFVAFDARDTSFPSAMARVKFNGDGALESSQLNKYFVSKYKSRQHYMNLHSAKKELSPGAYKSYRDSLQNENKKHRDAFINREKPSMIIEKWTQYQIEFEYYGDLLQYPSTHRAENNLSPSEWDYGDNYFHFVKDLPRIDKQTLINSYAAFFFPNYYRSFIREQEQKKVNYSLSALINQSDSLNFYGIIDQAKSNDLLTQLVLNVYLNQLLNAQKIEVYERYADVAFRYIKESFLRDPLERRYLEVKDNPRPARDNEDTFIKNLKDRESISYLDTILQKYSGKILFVDFWATWCRPCIKELPKAEIIRKEYEDFNIEFVYICLDSDEDKWSRQIAELGLEGEHYWLTKEQGKQIKENLKIRGAPFYFLADEKGDIHGHGFEFRLSDQKTRDKIEKLIM